MESIETIKQKFQRWTTLDTKTYVKIAVIVVLVILGVKLFLDRHTYHVTFCTASYQKETADTDAYLSFQDVLLRYNSETITCLSQKNVELWTQTMEFANPIVVMKTKTFAIADQGGNTVQIYDKNGLQGSFRTENQIEKIAVSEQGLVAAVLKNESTPTILLYDLTGRVLVESAVRVEQEGYPVALDLSHDGTQLAVSYLGAETNALRTRLVCYDFSGESQTVENQQVIYDTYTDSIVPQVSFLDQSTLLAVGDHSFMVYQKSDGWQQSAEVGLEKTIQQTFHTEERIGFVLSGGGAGAEVCLYNVSGEQTMSYELDQTYDQVTMAEDEIVLYEGQQCCILTASGSCRFEGDLKVEALLVVPIKKHGRTYLIMGEDQLKRIYLLI